MIENELGIFQLNRELSWFEGKINKNDMEVFVYLETDVEGGDCAEKAMNSLLEFSKNFEVLDEKYRKFAAEQLTELANDWLESANDPSGEILQEMFVQRIKMNEIIFYSSGKQTFYYDDNDMFWGHSIEITIDASGIAKGADIVG